MLKSSWKRVLFWINEQPSWLFLTDRSISTDQLLSSGWLSHPIQHFEACYCCRVQQDAAGCILHGTAVLQGEQVCSGCTLQAACG